MRRFFISQADFSKSSVTLTDHDEIHHIKNVLRFKKGQEVCVFNQKGQEAVCLIEQILADRIEMAIKEVKTSMAQNGPRVILACALPKKSKFEWIIEKCVELGVAEIYPLQTKRTEVILREEKMSAKLKRFEAVALNASKQSGRNHVPVIHPAISFQDVLKKGSAGALKLIPCLIKNRRNLFEVSSSTPGVEEVYILIGPEGDFTDEEVKESISAGYIPVSLGETTLKVETAAISTVSFVKLFFVRRPD